MDFTSYSANQMKDLNQISESAELVRTLYKDPESGKPIELSPTQVEIFDSIFKKEYDRVQVMTPSQYGKSLVVGLAVLSRASVFAEKWAIVAPTEEKAKIIMGYIIQHAFDNEFTKAALNINKTIELDRLRRERSKQRITLTVGDRVSEIFVLSADQKGKKEDAGNTLMGFGAANIVLDEAALIDDLVNAKVVRMLGGSSTTGTFLMKIGNPFRRGHFWRTHNSDRYHKIFVDWKIALKEKRFTQDFIDETKDEPLFDILYECKFPENEDASLDGWAQLISSKDLEMAQGEVQSYGDNRLGVDVADAGQDLSSIVCRSENYAEILFGSKTIDTMKLTGQIIHALNEKRANPMLSAVDKTGVGVSVCPRLREQGYKVHAFISQEKALRYEQFVNRRAEVYWALRTWIKGGGCLSKDKRWGELTDIYYKVDESNGKIRIMSKDEMKSKGIDSPNFADALAMTFAKGSAKLTSKDSYKEEYLNKNKQVRTPSGGLHLRATSY